LSSATIQATPPDAATAEVQARTATPPHSSERRTDIELMRVIAVVGVIAVHVSSGQLTPTIVGQHGLKYDFLMLMGALARPAVPVFIAIAGWALLSRRVSDDEERWLGKRAVRLIVPLLAWSAIYVVWALIRAGLTGERPWAGRSSLIDWLEGEAQLFYNGTGVRAQLWFMYFLIVATLVVWVVQAAGRTRHWATYAAGCAGLVMVWGAPPIFGVAAAWTTAAWFVGYFGLGWILLTRPAPQLGERLLALALFLGASGTLLYANLVGIGWAQSFVSPIVLIAAVGALIGLSGLTPAAPQWRWCINGLGALTYGVFLVHELSLDLIYLAWRPGGPIAFFTAGERVVLLLPASALLSFGLAWLWHRRRILTLLLG
jgi:surface polysaccharide O-acyltransferase-like enzyme